MCTMLRAVCGAPWADNRRVFHRAQLDTEHEDAQWVQFVS